MRKINSIKNFDHIKDYYYVTTCGRIISTYQGRNKILKPSTSYDGYYVIGLFTKDNIQQQFKVHRIVASAFIYNDNASNTCINHKNEIKTDNYVHNLEWCNISYNNSYGTRTSRSSISNLKDKNYFATHSCFRNNFINTCKRHGWNTDDFVEIFAEYYPESNGYNRKKFFYIPK